MCGLNHLDSSSQHVFIQVDISLGRADVFVPGEGREDTDIDALMSERGDECASTRMGRGSVSTAERFPAVGAE